MRKFYLYLFLSMLFTLTFQGCGGIPKDALSMNKATLEDRQLQTRVFDTSDEKSILSALASLLQDLGFNLDESETNLGLIVSSKERDATNAGQVVLSLLVALGGGGSMPIDSTQKIRASVVTSPVGENENRTAVRVTFQRIVWDTSGGVSRREKLNEPTMYQEFFEKLSKAVFLEAHSI
ncbi:MAG: hypothetical protein FVQ80_10195 [Planctomycetes bacterium]|nr:hypothetical protein [Planctomycetota bacterium]